MRRLGDHPFQNRRHFQIMNHFLIASNSTVENKKLALVALGYPLFFFTFYVYCTRRVQKVPDACFSRECLGHAWAAPFTHSRTNARHHFVRCCQRAGLLRRVSCVRSKKCSPASCEVRSGIGFLNARNVRPCDIHRQICEVCGEKATSEGLVRKWVSSMKGGRMCRDDDRQSLVNADLSERVDAKIRKNRRFTDSDLAMEFSEVWQWRWVEDERCELAQFTGGRVSWEGDSKTDASSRQVS